MNLASSLRAERLALDDIPVIDLSAFLQGAAPARLETATQIAKACRDIGFFYVVNHGIDAALVERAFAESKRFFDLPAARKNEIAIANSICHRGYYAIGDENLDRQKQLTAGDLKEGIKIGNDLPADHPLVIAQTPLHGGNLWPHGLPGWRQVMADYFAAADNLARQLLSAFALALELPEKFFEDKRSVPMATLSPIHYPPQQGPISEQRLGAGAHTDYGCITLLAQDSVGGLQVRNAAGSWVDATPLPGSFVVNIGDLMARWTNDLFTSTQHRVINNSNRDRYSIAFFFDPDFDAEVVCLESCQSAERPPRYPPTTAGRHLLEKIDASFDYRQPSEG